MHRIYLHVVWTTHQRLPLITADRARMLDRYLRITARHDHSRILAIGMVSTHVHLLLKIEPVTPLSVLVQALKGGSATVLNREIHDGPRLRWARGYSMHSVSARNLDAVRAYLAAQSEHHPRERIAGWIGEEVPLIMNDVSRKVALRATLQGDDTRKVAAGDSRAPRRGF